METKELKKVVRVAPVPANWNPYRQSIADTINRHGAEIGSVIGEWVEMVRATEGPKGIKTLQDRKSELRKALGAFAEGIAGQVKKKAPSFARNLASDLRACLLTGQEYRSGIAQAVSVAKKKGGSAKKAGAVKATTWQALLVTLEKAQEQITLLKGGKGLERSLSSLITRVTAKVPE